MRQLLAGFDREFDANQALLRTPQTQEVQGLCLVSVAELAATRRSELLPSVSARVADQVTQFYKGFTERYGNSNHGMVDLECHERTVDSGVVTYRFRPAGPDAAADRASAPAAAPARTARFSGMLADPDELWRRRLKQITSYPQDTRKMYDYLVRLDPTAEKQWTAQGLPAPPKVAATKGGSDKGDSGPGRSTSGKGANKDAGKAGKGKGKAYG
ncbi:unnamed protein product [Polarella glacialis]|uniref:Uncharacterized protein n=1 Tax=Polarella glacialis TaxID=89957 RepID=A0A813GTU4_POLGL|nr:unnamed protein product [Polarella glacialis]